MNKFICVMLLPMVLCEDFIQSLRGGQTTMKIGKSYKLHTTPVTFDEANKICKEEGGSLAVVTSKAEEQGMLKLWEHSGPILKASNGYNQQAFIGMHSLFTEGQWVTVEGKPLQYVNWSPDSAGGRQPSGLKSERCGALLKSGGMDDVECDLKLSFLCEIH